MDLISIFGLLLGLTAIIGGQLLEGGHIGSLIQPTAAMIVLGGTLGAVLLQNPMPVVKRAMRMMAWVWIPPVVDYPKIITQVLNWSQVSRREGLLSLENFINQLKDEFSRKGLQLLVDGAEPDRLRDVLEVDLSAYEEDMKQAAKFWEAAGGYSPTIGILGAVMGLIHVMENLSDPSKLGAGIAVAFVATIYGVGLANLFYLPVAGKIKAHIHRQVVAREMLIDGLVGIANGDNPRIIEGRLRGYIS